MPKDQNQINDITLKQADTKTEMLLLGYIAQEVERVQYGKISFEISVNKGKIVLIQSRPSTKTLKLDIGLD